MKQTIFREYICAAVIMCTLLSPIVAQAYVVTTSGGVTTSTAGAVTFADFDLPVTVDPAYATITGGTSNGGSDPGAGGNWIAADSNSGSGVVEITFTGSMDYFGLYWGTPDGVNNIVRLYNGTTLLATFDSGNSFWNVTAENAGENFNRIELASPGCCFEVDNFATRKATEPTAIPTITEWGMIILSILLASGAVFALRRKRQ